MFTMNRVRGAEPWSSRRLLTAVLCLGLIALSGSMLAAAESGAAVPLEAEWVEVGADHSCALLDSGEVLCWGSNSSGQIGDGSGGDWGDMALYPKPVSGLSDAIQITSGFAHSCAIRETGGAVCWGSNNSGQIGDGTATTWDEDFNEDNQDRTVPVPVVGLTDAVAISAGYAHTCAVRESGQAVCWGSNYSGKIGDGTASDFGGDEEDDNDRLTPTAVLGLTDAESISAGNDHTCAVRRTGQALCWGNNDYGQIGDGTRSSWDDDQYVDNNRSTATPVVGLSDAREVDAARDHTCAIREGGQALCWGGNRDGQIGDGTRSYWDDDDFVDNDRLTPTAVSGADDSAAILTGYPYMGGYSCALRDSGEVRCWGTNWPGRIGVYPGVTTPTPVSGLTGIKQVSALSYHGCAIDGSGRVSCLGSNSFGQIGDGTHSYWDEENDRMVDNDRALPVPIYLADPEPTSHALKVTRSGDGSGLVASTPAGIDCGAVCEASFDEGETVTLNAIASTGSGFSGWEGACTGSGSCVVTMDQARDVTASFAKDAPIPPPPPPRPEPTRLLIKRVAPKVKVVRAGKAIKLKVTVENRGGLATGRARVCAAVPKRPKGAFRASGCRNLGSLAPGSSGVAAFQVRTSRKARGNPTVRFRVAAPGTAPVAATAKIKVKRAAKRRR